MIRIGIYTGNTYDESVDIADIKECCRVYNTQPSKKDIEIIKMQCMLCQGDSNCLKGITA